MPTTELAPMVTGDALSDVVALVPDPWLQADDAHPSADAVRKTYVAYLQGRMARRNPSGCPGVAVSREPFEYAVLRASRGSSGASS